jgi:hypothetical protein
MTTNNKLLQSSYRVPFVKRVSILAMTVVLCIFGLAQFIPGPIQKKSYMGAEYCASCHQKEYQAWATSPHAKATDSLPIDEKVNSACLTCHATGLLDKSSFVLNGVQCESCHGPGEYYASLHVKKDLVLSKLLFMERPGIKSCSHCHFSSPNLWSPHKAIKKIDHWRLDKNVHYHNLLGSEKEN